MNPHQMPNITAAIISSVSALNLCFFDFGIVDDITFADLLSIGSPCLPCIEGAFSAFSLGELLLLVSCAMGEPQYLQNLIVGSSSFPHLGQNIPIPSLSLYYA